MEHIIDCTTIGGPRELHCRLAEALSFPDWYGNNLDALHDCLTARNEETTLIFRGWDAIAPFARGFQRVLMDAAAENPRLRVTFS